MNQSVDSLTLADEVVLLTLDCPGRQVDRALKIAGLPGLREVRQQLVNRGLLTHQRLRHVVASNLAPLPALRGRLHRIIRSVHAPIDADAELLLLVSFAGGLTGVSSSDHLDARHRIADLGARAGQAAPLVALLYRATGAESTADLADKLLPERVRIKPGELDPGVNPAVWGGGHGGGTLGG